MKPPRMRNVFHQYEKPENQLTHALATMLWRENGLMQKFLTEFLEVEVPKGTLTVLQQTLPRVTAQILKRLEKEKKGLPDMMITDMGAWCVFFEIKAAAELSSDQLQRHSKTIAKRGIIQQTGVVITVEPARHQFEGYIFRTWSEIYVWASSFRKISTWAQDFMEFLEDMDRKMGKEGYLRSGMLTDFIGIPFDEESFDSNKKRIIKALALKLKKRNRFDPALKVNLSSGKEALSNNDEVWDVLIVNSARPEVPFNEALHITLALGRKGLEIMLTVPNGIDREYKQRISAIENRPHFAEELREYVEKVESFFPSGSDFSPRMRLEQRHYLHQRFSFEDGKLEFDLRAEFPSKQPGNRVKPNKGWLNALCEIWGGKDTNKQVQIGLQIPRKYLTKLDPDETLDLIEKSCNALSGLVFFLSERNAKIDQIAIGA